jgi:SAM-dependent methyltransferase
LAHETAFRNAERFYDAYVKPLGAVQVIEIGSQDVNGSIRRYFPPPITYIGVDFADAKGVDVVLTDPYKLPFDDASIDVVLCNSCFEHSEFFWLTFMEMMRVLRPNGLCYLNAPSNGPVHGYPVDCWRFYPDSGKALQNWANRQGADVLLLESFTSYQAGGTFNDFVGVFLRDAVHLDQYPRRILDKFKDFENGYVQGDRGKARNPVMLTEDQRALLQVRDFLNGRLNPK